MSTLLKNAAEYQRGAMRRLYAQQKSNAYFLAEAMIGAQEAPLAVAAAFKALWPSLKAVPVADESALAARVTSLVAEECKKAVTRRDSKAFRLPKDRRFLLPTLKSESDDIRSVLNTLPAFHRVLFVLHAASGLDQAGVVAAMKLDDRTLQTAIADQEANFAAQFGRDTAYADMSKRLNALKESVSVPKTLDDSVDTEIVRLSAANEKKKNQRLTIVVAVIAVVLVLAAAFGVAAWVSLNPTDTTSSNAVTSVEATHYAEITIEDHGTIKVALDANTAPLTVNNFKSLADEGFYDGLTFHRIMEGFMMQGGDPEGNNTGGSGTNVVGEFSENGIENPLSHVRGAISMARSDDMNSASSQFFIVQEDSTFLDGKYAAFGYVTEGMEIVDTICQNAQPTDGNGTIPTDEQPIITKLIVYEA